MRVQDVISPRGGIVRGTRRPPGWTASGPAPRPPIDRSDLWPDADEDLCWLAGDWRILQRTEGHRFSLDDLVTAHFATRVGTFVAAPKLKSESQAPSQPSRLLDLGCGIGTVLMLMAWRFPQGRLMGIEAQPISAALARRSIAWNGIGDRCHVVLGDLRDPTTLETDATFDLITGTPPYFPRGTGLESDQVQRGPCRFEHRGGVEDYAAAAARYLGPGPLSAFVACAAATQADRVAKAASAAGLFVDRLREVVPREGKAPLLIVFSMRRRDHAAPYIGETPLVVRDATGHRTEEFVALRAEMGMPP